ncbi:MAG: hypothetical protein PHP31_09445 [Lentimicrobiaceae bacterium]|nr:hypothetical protein [Lentimicrobiaceae bacterium]
MKKSILLIGIMSLAILFSSQISFAQKVIASTPEQKKAIEESMRRRKELRKQYEAMTPEQQAEARKRVEEMKKGGGTDKNVKQTPQVEKKVISKEEFEKNSKKVDKPQVNPDVKKEATPKKVELQSEKKVATEKDTEKGRIVAKPKANPDVKKEVSPNNDEANKRQIHKRPETEKMRKQDRVKAKNNNK